VLEGSPIPLLERSCDRALEPGELGMILAPPGLGKSTLLAQFGLAEMLAGRSVLHVTQGDSIRRVRSRYEELLGDYSRHGQLADPVAARAAVERNHLVQSYAEGSCSTAHLTTTLAVLAEHAQFTPQVILVDGVDWRSGARAQLAGWRALAWAHGAVMWLTAVTRRAVTQLGPDQLPGVLSGMTELVDRTLQLRAVGAQVSVHAIAASESNNQGVLLDSTWMRAPLTGGAGASPDHRQPGRFTLYSGAAVGTEACFGEQAERFGLAEVHFSYPGHEPVRERGLCVLSERELRKGDVSLAYANRRMARSFKLSHSVRRILQTQWHQVHSADQVLVIGELCDDGTLRGGTGWAGELARIWGKPLWVFDQPREQWFRWSVEDSIWQESGLPRIVRARFCGTGTRKLTPAGRRAIEAVFEASFGSLASASSSL